MLTGEKFSMKETSKEARPHIDFRERQVDAIVQCVSYYGALSRKQISELTNIGYTSVCPRVLETMGTIFKMVGKEMINKQRYELIDLIRRINPPDEVYNKRFYKRMEVNKPMYEGETTKCDSCDGVVRAKENGKPVWIDDGFKPDGKKKWRLVDIDGEMHNCSETQANRDEHILSETKRKAAGVPPIKEDNWDDESEGDTDQQKPSEPFYGTKEQDPMGSDPNFQRADTKLTFDQTYKIIEVTASVTRKAGPETIPQLPQFENLSFFAAFKAELELGHNLQQVLTKLFAEGTQSLDRQIGEARRRLSDLE